MASGMSSGGSQDPHSSAINHPLVMPSPLHEPMTPRTSWMDVSTTCLYGPKVTLYLSPSYRYCGTYNILRDEGDALLNSGQ